MTLEEKAICDAIEVLEGGLVKLRARVESRDALLKVLYQMLDAVGEEALPQPPKSPTTSKAKKGQNWKRIRELLQSRSYTAAELAAVLGITRSAVRCILYRNRRLLKVDKSKRPYTYTV